MPAPTLRARITSVVTPTSSYSSPTSRARSSAPPRLRLALRRQRRVERQGQRHLDHVDEVEPSVLVAAAGLGLLGRRQPAGGGDDVVVELGAEDRHEDVAELDLRHLLGQGPLGDRDPLGQRSSPRRSGGRRRRRRRPKSHPAAADPAGVVVVGEHADEGEAAERAPRRAPAAAARPRATERRAGLVNGRAAVRVGARAGG